MKKCFILLLAMLLLLTGCQFTTQKAEPLSGMEITYLDVGNADCEIIRMEDGTNIVIDAGTKDQSGNIIRALKRKGIRKIDYLIATHPHADHIGGMEDIIDSAEIGTVVFPSVVHTSKTYENLLKKIKEKEIPAVKAESGVVLHETDRCKIQLVAPKKDEKYESLNNYSAVLHIAYGNTTFLFAGDAEKLSENEMLNYEIRSDVLKVGHHGSRTSSSEKFIAKVNPRIAVISCGKDNEYGHPHQETLETLKNAEVYRTDKNGDIIIHTDGTNLTVATEK
ncbi:ComEC/Rec2 family competence protein [Acetivibrio sp. MSJd-27]|uniref:ComEC/Rec2 family competence protein n=1 Tax=Acetivibrio sp. MSJd-27 TaxID=2841523 RepID=UPI001C122DED|nr:ComEC/Rec2 family competence protein [Acetivibrio sp. MSJd-27]MBU5450631.1 MBL fold metallo-hydrolase [Acetivibrio sp. MSJd-27]